MRRPIVLVAAVLGTIAVFGLLFALLRSGSDGTPMDQDASPSPSPSAGASPTPAGPAGYFDVPEWESMEGPPGAGRVEQLLQAADEMHTLYARNGVGVFASADSGETWSQVAPLAGLFVTSIAVSTDTLLACADGLPVAIAPDGTATTLDGRPCHSVAAGDGWVMVSAPGPPGGATIAYSHSVAAEPIWTDISPTPDEIGTLSDAGWADLAPSQMLPCRRPRIRSLWRHRSGSWRFLQPSGSGRELGSAGSRPSRRCGSLPTYRGLRRSGAIIRNVPPHAVARSYLSTERDGVRVVRLRRDVVRDRR